MFPMDKIRETDLKKLKMKLGNEIPVFDDKIKKIMEVYASEIEKSKDFGDDIKRGKKLKHQQLDAKKLKHILTIFKSGLQGVWGMPRG